MAKFDVDIFIPCFIDQLYPETGFNMVKVLEKLGCTVRYNSAQTCCGQPAYNAGYFKDAAAVALKMLKDLDSEADYIVGPSASCVGMIRNGYADLFNDDLNIKLYNKIKAKIFEFTEFLTDVLRVTEVPGACLNGRATYHDSCSALRECGIKDGPRKLLANVEGLQLVEMAETDACCGFGGTFAVKFEAISSGMAEMKIENALAVQPDYIISTDSSCLLQYQTMLAHKGIKIRTMHIADVLASGW
jgi:L-lactate dehydrogenase complex protein LldE